MTKGIDISTFQKNIDYSKLKNQIDFAIIRSGFGKNANQKDSLFDKHYEGLKKQNIKVGVYHYSYATTVDNAVIEALNCLNFIANKKLDLPVFYDVEDTIIKKSMNKEKITLACLKFCYEIEKAGFKAGVYASLDWFKNYIDVQKIIDAGYLIWLAQWNDKITADFKPHFWQYSNKGKIDGILGNVDLDYNLVENVEQKQKNVDNVEKNVEKFVVGKTYKTQVILKVRAGAGTNNRQKDYLELTENAKQNAYKTGVNKGCLKNGTKVTVLEIKKLNNDIWLRIPSGWIAGFYSGKDYVK